MFVVVDDLTPQELLTTVRGYIYADNGSETPSNRVHSTCVLPFGAQGKCVPCAGCPNIAGTADGYIFAKTSSTGCGKSSRDFLNYCI